LVAKAMLLRFTGTIDLQAATAATAEVPLSVGPSVVARQCS